MVVDRSGSMSALEEDVRGGFNSFLDDAAKMEESSHVRVTAVLFDDRYEVLASAVPPAEVPRLTDQNYTARGMTALLDAIGRTINDFEASTKVHHGDKVMLVVQTDGAENSSREFTSGQIMSMLREREGRGWTTVYNGAGPQAWGQGRSLGFGINVNTAGDSQSTVRSYTTTSAALSGLTRGASSADTRRLYETLDKDADTDSGGEGGQPGAAGVDVSRGVVLGSAAGAADGA